MYYNPQTQEMLSDQELKNLLNCSFPKDTESVEGWLCIHESRPEPEEGKMPVKDSIEVKDGRAVQTYRMEDVPEPDSISSDEMGDLARRIALLEDALKPSIRSEVQSEASDSLAERVSILEGCIKDLAAMMSNLQIYCTNAVNEMKAKD